MSSGLDNVVEFPTRSPPIAGWSDEELVLLNELGAYLIKAKICDTLYYGTSDDGDPHVAMCHVSATYPLWMLCREGGIYICQVHAFVLVAEEPSLIDIVEKCFPGYYKVISKTRLAT